MQQYLEIWRCVLPLSGGYNNYVILNLYIRVYFHAGAAVYKQKW